MDFPAEVSIPLSIEQGCIYLYEFEAMRSDGSLYKGNRFFIVLNANPKTDEVLILTTITKQIESQEKYIKITKQDPDTLVRISPSDFKRLNVESVVNCNNINELSMSQLVEKIKKGGKIFYEKLPRSCMDAIISGVLKSTQVSQEHKTLVL